MKFRSIYIDVPSIQTLPGAKDVVTLGTADVDHDREPFALDTFRLKWIRGSGGNFVDNRFNRPAPLT